MRHLAEMMDLSGRVALVTGGGGRIGAAIVEALAELHASVAILDSDRARAEQVANDIGAAYPVKVLVLAADLEDTDNVPRAVGEIERAFGRLDILVNCAAFVGTSELKGWAVPFAEQDLATWKRALDVNLTAAFALAQNCAPLLTESGSGSIINVASIYGLVGPDLRLYDGTGYGNPAAYAASKGGLLQLTRWLATVMAPSVRVNAITPGGVWRDQAEAFVERYVERKPLRRMAAEEDIKGAIAYLASDLSSYVTGQNVVVDGGWTAW